MNELEFIGVFFAFFLFWVIGILIIAFFMNGRK